MLHFDIALLGVVLLVSLFVLANNGYCFVWVGKWKFVCLQE
jgi:hypothetical protein